MRRLLGATAWTIGLGAAAAVAGPLNRACVSADAKWVVHVNVEAAMASTIGKCLCAHQDELNIKPVIEFKEQTGLDAFKDIKGVTVYGLSSDADRGVAVVVGTARLEDAVNKLVSDEKTVKKIENDGRTIYQWHEHGSDKFGFLKRAPTGDDRILVVSRSPEELNAALAVMDGGASLAGASEGAMAAKPRAGSAVFVAMRDLDLAKEPHGPKILRSAKEMSADFGEDAEGVYGEAHLKAASAKDIQTISSYANLMLGYGKLVVQDEPDMADVGKFLDGITVESHDLEFSAKFRIGKDQLAVMVDQVNSGKGPLGSNKHVIEKPVSNPAASGR